jgi:hypothetical protein
MVLQMSLSLIKRELLETLLLRDKPARVAQIAEEAGQKFPPAMMHLLGLTRMGYAYSPEKGLYAITERGKKALGLPEIGKETAKAILADTPQDKVFHFYADIGKPLNCCAQSLKDFCDKILKISVDSIEFHLSRGDFESWFTGLGDVELARKATLLKEKRLVGEELRARLHEIVENRCMLLATLV